MESKTGFMCKVCYDWEIGEALGGTVIYPDIEDLKENCSCGEYCGIVKVEIKLLEVVKEGRI